MKKRTLTSVLLVAIIISAVSTPSPASASGLKTPELKVPVLGKFSEIIDNFKSKLGKKDLEPPTVEKPEGFGSSATEVFDKNYGDMWQAEERQLDRKSAMPDQSVLNAIREFGKKNDSELNTVRQEDREKLTEMVKKQLDTSHVRDLSSIKENFMRNNPDIDVNSYLAGTPKPQGWGSAPAKPSLQTPPSLGRTIDGTEIPGATSEDSLMQGVHSLADKAGKWIEDTKEARQAHLDNLAYIQGKQARGEKITNEEKQMLIDSAKKSNETTLRPLNAVKDFFAGRSKEKRESRALVDQFKNDFAREKAEQKHGKGNVTFLANVFGEPKYISKNTIPGKIVYNLWGKYTP